MNSTVVGLKREGIKIHMVNVRSAGHVADKYGVRRVPTFVYTEGGEEMRRKTGNQSRASLIRMCRKSWF